MSSSDSAFHAINTPAQNDNQPVTGRRKYTHTAKYKPMFDEAQAREIVLCRMDEINRPGGPRTLSVFAKKMYEYGLTRKVASVSLLSRLLGGDLIPNLTDREGRPIRWADVPRATRGRRATAKSLKTQVRDLQRHVTQISQVLRVVCDRMGVDADPYPDDPSTCNPFPDDSELDDVPTQSPAIPQVKYVDDLPVVVTPSETVPQPTTVPPPRRS